MTDSDYSAPLAGAFEPQLAHTLLPRCAACQAPHPLARRPPQFAEVCPDCGAAQAQGPTVVVPAVIAGRGPAAWLARACFALAAWLRRLIERI